MQKITKTILAAVLISANLFFSSQTVSAQFPLNIGAASSSDQSQCITTDVFGNIFVTGRFDGMANFTGKANITLTGFYDIYVTKYNSSGACLWAFDIVTAGSPADADIAEGITTDASGNVYLTGSFKYAADFRGTSAGHDSLSPVGDQDIFVAKYDSSGAYQWAFSIGTPGQEIYTAGYGIATDATNNVYVTGEFQGTADFKGTSTVSHKLTTSNDAFVAKYNSAGAYQWAFNLNSSGSYGAAIATDGNNNVLVTGVFSDTADFKGTSTTPKVITGLGYEDGFVAKFNSAGVNQWAFNIGSASTLTNIGSAGVSSSVATDATGNVLVTGNFGAQLSQGNGGTADFKGMSAGPDILTANGTADVYVAKYDATGAYQWAFNIGSSANWSDKYGAGIATDASGNVDVIGDFAGTADFKGTSAGPNTLKALGTADVFVAQYNATGAYQCAFNIGSAGNEDNGSGIATDAYGNVLVTGNFSGTANFNPLGVTDNLSSAGYQDAFLSKYNACILYGKCIASAGSNQSICLGLNTNATIGATALTGNTYNWSPATGLSSATVSQPTASPAVTTTYTLTQAITATGCQATGSVTVFVGVQPSVPVISPSGPTTICSSESVTFNPGSGYADYSWSNGATTQSIKVINQGSYSVTVSNAPGCSAVSSVTNVTVIPSPAAITGPNKAICPGMDTIIGAAQVTGDTYSWYPSTGLSSDTVSQPTASPVASTWYKLTETMTANGCQRTDSVLVNVNSPRTPVISPSGPIAFCTGGSVTLNAGSGYSRYLWSDGESTQTINISTQGSYSVTVTNSYRCSAASYAINVTVSAPASPVINQKGDTLFCSLSANSYQWYLNDTLISGATNEFYLPSKNGNYTVTMIEEGCSSTSPSFNLAGEGINPVAAVNELLIIYPSPASAYFIAESKTAVLQSVTMYDILGKRVLSAEIKNAGNKKVRVNIETLPAGLYFVQLKTDNAVSTIRLVKE